MGKIRRKRKTYLSNPFDLPPRLHVERNMSSENKSYIAPSFAHFPEPSDKIFSDVDLSQIPTVRIYRRDDVSTAGGSSDLATSHDLPYRFDGSYINTPACNFDDRRTTISTNKSVFKNRGVSKVERRKLRHQTFIERINDLQSMKPATISLQPMKPATNSLQPKNVNKTFLVKAEPSTSGPITTMSWPLKNVKTIAEDKDVKTMRQGRIVKSRVRHTRMLKDIAVLTKLWENPEYKADPSGFVSDTVHERVAKEIE